MRPVGSIRDNGNGSFWIRVKRGYRPDGKERVITETFHGTRQEAQIRAAEIAQQMGRSDAYGSGMTLETYYRTVFKRKPSNRGKPRSKATWSQYDGEMERHILPELGRYPLERITHEMMAACIRRSSSASTKTVLRAVMRSAYDDGLVADKPLERRVAVHKERRPKPMPWSRFEVSQALSAPWEPDLELYLLLGLSGLRMEEVLGLHAEDLKLSETYSFSTGEKTSALLISIRRAYTDKGGMGEPKNDQSARTVPAVPQFAARIAELATGRDRLVPLSGSSLYSRWKTSCKKFGLRFIPPSMLRHTSDTLMLTAGVDRDLAAKLHGRSNPQTTYEHYFRPDESAMLDALETVGKLVSRDTSG